MSPQSALASPASPEEQFKTMPVQTATWTIFASQSPRPNRLPRRLGASGLAPWHDLSVKLPTFTVKPVHALVFMRIYQKPERLTIANGFVATKRG
jgi:hypothetical protein